jgi:hypothetical protein
VADGRPVDAGLIARVSGAINRRVSSVVSGARSAWFGPGDPQEVTAPPGSERLFDYPTWYNNGSSVRDTEFVQFGELRALAESYDVLRLAIETRKDQVSRLDWEIRNRADQSTDDPRIKQIVEFLQYPDREHSWSTWIRIFLEDVFVLDAGTLYPRMTRGGEPYSLEVLDGATIRRVIDAHGRTPDAPSVAYQQILHGVPAANFSRDQLFYLPRNVRPSRLYGYGPVEQVMITINIALRRQTSVLHYYTEGNVPEALATVPEHWTPDQIRSFQEFWDILIEGDTAQRRHMKFLPGGVEYTPTREPTLKDAYDEWLARVVCYALSLPPTAFISQMNRATAQSSQEQALEEGLEPVKRYLKDTLDLILARFFNAPDLEFVWRFETALDRLTQAQIHQIYVGSGILTADEARSEIGLGALTPAQKKELQDRADPLTGAKDAPSPSKSDPKSSTTL